MIVETCYTGTMIANSERQRFMDKVGVQGNTECWPWLGAKGSGGRYGAFRRRGKIVSAHRFAYRLFIGEIPEGLTVDHLCGNKLCQNPRHLEAVPNAENVRRAAHRAFENRETCRRGHEINEENTYITQAGHRYCRKCHNLKQNERRNAGR